MKRAWLLALVAACADRETVEPAPGEIILHLDTDAPLPASQGTRLPEDAPTPLFDRVRVEVFAPGASTPCAGCTNEFPLDIDLVRSGAASVGIAPTPHATGFRARVRLFFSSVLDPSVETVIALPPVDDHGRIDVSVVLHADDLGTPVGTLDAPVDPTIAPPDPSVVATWAGATRVPCAGAPHDGEACVPGGAFWMGTTDTLLDTLPSEDALGPHLVVLSPFFMRTHEVTVADVVAARVRPQIGWSGQKGGNNVTDFCTFTSSGANDALPANCLLWGEAASVCEALGGELPTEAQYEYVAGHFEGRRFVWGQDPPECGDAVFGRGGWGLFGPAEAPCKTSSPPGGVSVGGQGARDRLELPSGTIVDLAGNVSEWSRDNWNRHDERCWSSPRVYRDPLCTRTTKDPFDHPARGGEWLVLSGQLTRATRTGASSITATPEVGFRCTRPGR